MDGPAQAGVESDASGKALFSTATIDKNQTASLTVGHGFEHRRVRHSLPMVVEGVFGVRMYRLATVSDNAVSWVLRRNCSVTPRQLAGLFGLLCVVSLTIAGFFWMQGAWMVLAFSALELLAVGLAFVVYAQHATDGEIICLSQGRLVVETEQAGRIQRVEFLGRSLRVDAPLDQGLLVELRGGGQTASVGRFVRPEWRPILARELRHALGLA